MIKVRQFNEVLVVIFVITTKIGIMLQIQLQQKGDRIWYTPIVARFI